MSYNHVLQEWGQWVQTHAWSLTCRYNSWFIKKTADPGDKQAWGQLLTAPLRGRTCIHLTHAKLINDATIGESIDIDKALVRLNKTYWDRPVPYRSR